VPNFTAQDWVTIVQGIGIISVISLGILYLLGWQVLPFIFKEVWPVWRERWRHASTQLDRVMEKREADQDKFLHKLDDLQLIRERQMREQTDALTRAIHEKDERLVAELKAIRSDIRESINMRRKDDT
jgi:hypothetical protein